MMDIVLHKVQQKKKTHCLGKIPLDYDDELLKINIRILFKRVEIIVQMKQIIQIDDYLGRNNNSIQSREQINE